MQRGRQGAATGHERFRLSVEANAARAGLEIDLLGPTAAQPIVHSVSDAVDFSLWTAGRGFGNQAIPAGVAGAMHVEKGYAIAFAERLAFNVQQFAANLVQTAD